MTGLCGCRYRKAFLLLALLVLSPTPVWAQKDAGAVDQLSRTAVLLGASRGELRSLTGDGTLVYFGGGKPDAGSFEVSLLAPDQVRWDVRLPSGTFSTIIRGLNGWSGPADGLRLLSISETFGQGAEFFPLLFIRNWIESTTVRVDAATSDPIDSPDLLRLPVNLRYQGAAPEEFTKLFEGWSARFLYIDRDSGLPERLEFTRSTGDDRLRQQVALVFSDFQDVDGCLFPATVTEFLEGQPTRQFQFNHLQLNAPVSEQVFKVR